MLLSLTYKSNSISERQHIFFLCLPLPFLFQLRQQHRHLPAHLRLHYSHNSCCRTCLENVQEGSGMPSHFFALQPIPAKCHSLTGHRRATTAQEPQDPPLFHIAFQITHSTENECRTQSKTIVPPGKPHFPPVCLVWS